VLPLQAGPELSVAATKSFVTSLAAGAAIMAQWTGEARLRDAVSRLPETLSAATQIEWPAFEELAGDAASLYVLGRGPSLPIAAETALKLKETCAIHAEAHSTAEVMHGPLELMEAGFPVLAYAPDDAAAPSIAEAVNRMRQIGANLCVVARDGMSYVPTGHFLVEPISLIQTAYLAIEHVAVARGRDPDHPRLLRKVTETL
jgi:glucosamine--fructose-6-phosphate aminotransferase (isomerizing)